MTLREYVTHRSCEMNRRQLVDFESSRRLPTLHGVREYVDLGSLMAHGANRRAANKRAAWYVDRILHGAKPADTPIKQRRVFELIVNMNAAQLFNTNVPPDVAPQVTEWVA